jgi:hypothetical protein
MPDVLATTSLVISPMPTAHFGARAISALPGIVQRAGADAAVIVTDVALAATPVVPRIARRPRLPDRPRRLAPPRDRRPSPRHDERSER